MLKKKEEVAGNRRTDEGDEAWKEMLKGKKVCQ